MCFVQLCLPLLCVRDRSTWHYSAFSKCYSTNLSLCVCVCVCVCCACLLVCVADMYNMTWAALKTSHLKRERLVLHLYHVEHGHNCDLTIV